MVVRPEEARKQLNDGVELDVVLPPGESDEGTGGDTGEITAKPVSVPTRFYGTVELDAMRMSRDAGQVADEVVKHLTGLVDAEVEVRLEVTATRDEGFPDDVLRTVTENARTLKFDQHGFETE
jgi:hypothetical protein